MEKEVITQLIQNVDAEYNSYREKLKLIENLEYAENFEEKSKLFRSTFVEHLKFGLDYYIDYARCQLSGRGNLNLILNIILNLITLGTLAAFMYFQYQRYMVNFIQSDTQILLENFQTRFKNFGFFQISLDDKEDKYYFPLSSGQINIR